MADNVGPIKRGGFPQSLMPVSQQTMGKPAKTVVNTDKDLGLEMYAVSLVDPQNDPCFFRFWTNNAYDWDRIFIVEPDRDVDPYRIQIMMSGTLKDGYYYGYGSYGKYGRYGRSNSKSQRYGAYGSYGSYGSYGNYVNSHYGDKNDTSIKV